MADGGIEFKLRGGGAAKEVLRVFVFAAAATAAFVLVFPHGTEMIRSKDLWTSLLDNAQGYLIVAMGVWLILWSRLRFMYERLHVGSESLRYASPLAGPFRFLRAFHPDWCVAWAELRGVELQVQSLGLGKRRYTLVLSIDSGQRIVEWPLSWQRVPFVLGSDVSPPPRDEAAMRRAIMNSPLVQALRNRGIQVLERPGLVKPQGVLKGYDIGEDKRLLVAVGIMLVALVYYFGDTFINWPYMALDDVPVWPYVLAGSLGLWLGYDLGRNAPRMERTLISIMLAGSLCAACYPLMLRFNALTAPAGGDLYAYTQVKPGYFKPPKADMPWIYFDNQPAYWVGLPGNATHQFRVLKGVLGFYEVDTHRVQADISAWWAMQKSR